jgi:hypothetical protein
MIKRKTKINTAVLASLIISSLLVTTQAVTQTIASSGQEKSPSYNLVSLTTKTYSDEVDLNSASEYSPEVMKKQKIYKKILKEKLEKRLEKVNSNKLEKIIDKIDKYLEIYQDKDNIDESKRTKILAQLLALKEVIQERLENSKEYSIEINLDEILNV